MVKQFTLRELERMLVNGGYYDMEITKLNKSDFTFTGIPVTQEKLIIRGEGDCVDIVMLKFPESRSRYIYCHNGCHHILMTKTNNMEEIFTTLERYKFLHRNLNIKPVSK